MIDTLKAKLIAGELSVLDEELAAQAEELINDERRSRNDSRSATVLAAGPRPA